MFEIFTLMFFFSKYHFKNTQHINSRATELDTIQGLKFVYLDRLLDHIYGFEQSDVQPLRHTSCKPVVIITAFYFFPLEVSVLKSERKVLLLIRQQGRQRLQRRCCAESISDQFQATYSLKYLRLK
jgi:hypothetical protein